jgi:hypothetical protein
VVEERDWGTKSKKRLLARIKRWRGQPHVRARFARLLESPAGGGGSLPKAVTRASNIDNKRTKYYVIQQHTRGLQDSISTVCDV